MSLQNYNNDLSLASSPLTTLENAFPKIIQDKINTYGQNAFHQVCEYLFNQILQAAGSDQEQYLEYNASFNEETGKTSTPYWDARIFIDLSKTVKLQLIPTDGSFAEGAYKVVKKAVTVQFKLNPASLKDLSVNWTVLILAKKIDDESKEEENSQDLLSAEDFFQDNAQVNTFSCQRGVRKLEKLLQLNCPNLIEMPLVYPTSPFQASQAWYNTTLLRAIEERSIFLDRFEEKQKPITSLEILNVMLDAGEAIKHLHQHGYVHCDVKPANLLATFEKGQLKGKLADLDLVTSIGDKFGGSAYPFRATTHNLYGLATPFSDVYGFLLSMAPLILGKGLIKYFQGILDKGSCITAKNFDAYLDYSFLNIPGFSLNNSQAQPAHVRWNLTKVQENYVKKFRQIIECDEHLTKTLCPSNKTQWHHLTENNRLDHLKEWNIFSAAYQIPSMEEIIQFSNEKIRPYL